jgi:hypothetical protein
VTSDNRWRIYPLAVLGTLLVVVVVMVATTDGTSMSSGRLGGDLPEFIGAGRIVADGDGVGLYDPERQLVAQADLWDGPDRTGILFAYPAVLAAPYAAVASWSFSWVYVLHTGVMVGCVYAAARVLVDRMELTVGRAWIPLGLAVSLTFLPMFIGVFNGQVTAAVLVGLVAAWALASDGRDGAAGAVAGLMLLKPQYGLVVIGLLVLARRWRAVPGILAGAAAIFVGSAFVSGWGWIASWWDLVSSLSDIDGGSNLSNEVSWLGVSEALLGQGSTAATALGVVLSLATCVVVGVCLWGRDVRDPMVPALVLPALVLIAPHSLYYDAGLLLVAVVALLAHVAPERRVLVVAVWWAAGLSHGFASSSTVEPVFLLVVVTLGWAVATAWSSRTDPVTRRGRGPSLAA